VLFLLILGCISFSFHKITPSPRMQVMEATLRGEQLLLEVADTPELRTQGLSGREKLSQGSGMLFIFDNMNLYGFWMKDMKFSLDIMWLDADKKIVYIEKNLSSDTYPTIFTPASPAQYVLEVPAGFVDNSNVSLGDFLDIKAK